MIFNTISMFEDSRSQCSHVLFQLSPRILSPHVASPSSRKALPTGGPTQWRHDTTDLELGAIQLSIPSVIAIDTRTRNSRWPWRNASFSPSSWRLKAKSPEKSHLPSMAGEGYFSETKMGNILKSTCLPIQKKRSSNICFPGSEQGSVWQIQRGHVLN